MEAHYLSKAVHLLRNSHPGCFRVWDEVKQDVVITVAIKPLSMLPIVESFLHGQQNGPGRQGEVKDEVLQSQCKISAVAAAQVLGPGVDLPALSLQGASSHSEEPCAEARGHPEAAMVKSRACSGAKMSPEVADAKSSMSFGGAVRGPRRVSSIARLPSITRKWVEMAVAPTQVKF